MQTRPIQASDRVPGRRGRGERRDRTAVVSAETSRSATSALAPAGESGRDETPADLGMEEERDRLQAHRDHVGPRSARFNGGGGVFRASHRTSRTG